ncbi:hypothetical protein DXG01_001549 [Tephrocybe rancida]|nr:hypothetical protein DXG01_001549 [Tephrocybe rancida]
MLEMQALMEEDKEKYCDGEYPLLHGNLMASYCQAEWVAQLATGKVVTEEMKQAGCGAYYNCRTHYPNEEDECLHWPTWAEAMPGKFCLTPSWYPAKA